MLKARRHLPGEAFAASDIKKLNRLATTLSVKERAEVLRSALEGGHLPLADKLYAKYASEADRGAQRDALIKQVLRGKETARRRALEWCIAHKIDVMAMVPLMMAEIPDEAAPLLLELGVVTMETPVWMNCTPKPVPFELYPVAQRGGPP